MGRSCFHDWRLIILRAEGVRLWYLNNLLSRFRTEDKSTCSSLSSFVGTATFTYDALSRRTSMILGGKGDKYIIRFMIL